MNYSIITIRTIDGVDYILLRDNSNPRATYLEVGGKMTPITIKDYMSKYNK